MGIQDLQSIFESEGVSVDLFRIGRNHPGGCRLVLDAEGCLDRLYGGFFSDWACGGQWVRCVQFLSSLRTALAEHNVMVVICLSGAYPTPCPSSPPSPPLAWLQAQQQYRHRVNDILRHIATKGTPPPKVWWVPPMGLHSCLRSALHQMNVPLMVSSDDHHQEVVGLCRERYYAGIVGNSGEYLAFQPPRYFSSSQLKLTYRSSLETKEYMVHDFAQWLELSQDRLCLLAALLGNTVLTEQHLRDFHKRVSNTPKKATGDDLVRAVCDYVRCHQNSDLDTICVDIFGDIDDHRCALLKQAVQYYVNGTKDGFLKYKTASARKPRMNKKLANTAPLQKESDIDTLRLSTDVDGGRNASDWHPESMIDGGETLLPERENRSGSNQATSTTKSQGTNTVVKSVQATVAIEVLRTCAERHAKGLMHPWILSILSHRQLALPTLLEDEMHMELPDIHTLYRPIRQHVYAILFNMHHHNFMASKAKEGEKPPPLEVTVNEWIYTRQNPGKTPVVVEGVPVDWHVPTVRRLWFGTANDDRRRRLRAFLSCMRSDTPLMLNTSYVPQHLLVLATVLRYIITTGQCLRRHELDAFLATAFCSDLRNPLHLQTMTLPTINVRGVQLGTLLMTGVEMALLANDACGAPVPMLVTSPWTFFDGKLFQHKLARANTVKSLIQLCDNQVDIVVKVERMRKAILEMLNVEFAIPPLPLSAGLLGMGYPPPGILSWSGRGNGGGMGARGGAAARLKVAGVVVGQWGAGAPSYHVGYPMGPRGYTGYVGGGRGFGGRQGGGRGRSRGGHARNRRHRGNGGRAKTNNSNALNANGKKKSDDSKGANGCEESPNSSDACVDSTTDDCSNQTEQDAVDKEDGEESAGGSVGEGGVQGGRGRTRGGKRGKKKGTNKTDSPAKCEANGPILDATSIKTKVGGKTLVMMNGGNGASPNGDHKGQGDAPLDQ